MQVGDIARLRLEKQRLQRDRAALGAGKVRELEWQRDRHPVEFDCEAPDLPQAELLENGPGPGSDSPAKFEKMLSCFGVLISQAKQGEFQLDPERGGACSGGDLPVKPDGWAESQREEQALQRERQKREALEKELSRWRPRNRGYLARVPWGA